MAILRRLSAGMVSIGRKIIAMNAEFLSEEEVVRITDSEFVTIRRDDLKGEFDLRVVISTAEEDERKASELSFMLQTMGNNLPPDFSLLILTEIARLRKMPQLADKFKNYQPQPDPLQQKKIQLEMMLLQAQFEKEMALARKHSGEAQLAQLETLTERYNTMLTEAKIGTEYAKARNLNTQSDNNELKFVEQESGVTQERNLQKLARQSQAQGATKILEHALNKLQPAQAE